MGAYPASDGLVELGIVQHGVDSFASHALEDASGLRASELELDARETVGVRVFPVGRDDPEPLGVAIRQGDEHHSGVDETPEPLGDEHEQGIELELAGEGIADLAERLEMPQP